MRFNPVRLVLFQLLASARSTFTKVFRLKTSSNEDQLFGSEEEIPSSDNRASFFYLL